IGIALAGGVIFGLPFVITAFTKVNDWRRTIVFAASWTFVLWLREWMLTGFPWNPIANIAMPWPAFSNSMSLWGALGLTFIIVGLIASVAEIIKGTRIPFYIFISLLIVGVGYGHWNILQSVEFCKQDCRHPVIRIVQPAGSAEQKATHSREQALARAEENLNKLMELSAGKNYVSSQGAANAESPGSGRDKGIENIQNNHNSDFSNADRVPDNFARATQNFRDDTPDIIVWPETAYPYVVVGDNPSSPSFAEARFPPAKEIGLPVVAGATLVSNPYSAVREDTKVYNSMIVSDASGAIQKIYSKSHLVPFGEYRPFGDIIPTPGQLSRGQGPEIIAVSNEQIANSNFSFVPAICYEVIFSDSLIPADGKGGMGDGINAIINITNDTWFGRTPGTYQHLDMARRQAIETGLPIVRANYSGISAFIASDGRVVSSLPIGAAGILDGSVSGAHITPYRRIGRDWIMFIILAVSGMAVLLFRQVRRQ
ncbi:MAG: apolipoprotein N-acyltransferase, partial [Rickettsiales bacterium]|nr:apolipoprotein N-acyltransferase [Rickettsiales bacterium]